MSSNLLGDKPADVQVPKTYYIRAPDMLLPNVLNLQHQLECHGADKNYNLNRHNLHVPAHLSPKSQ